MMPKMITSFNTLMFYASELATAIRNEEPQTVIEELRARHDSYRDLCLRSDEVSLNHTSGDLDG